MEFLKIFLTVYLSLGFIYAVFILIRGSDKWYWFPINLLFGPITVLYLLFATIRGTKLPSE